MFAHRTTSPPSGAAVDRTTWKVCADPISGSMGITLCASSGIHADRSSFHGLDLPPAPGPRSSPLASTSRSGPTSSLAEYELIRTIGVGSFGRVILAKERSSGRPVALKRLSKFNVLRDSELDHLLWERQVMALMSSVQESRCPFLVQLLGSFQDEAHVYLVLEYAPGGDMFSLLSDVVALSEEHSRFYAAECLLALEALHDRCIIYRDLKPENVLIGADGHIKLSDFGFARFLTGGQSHTLCGTPEYSAPEVVLNAGHGAEADFWALGVLLYEMVAGQSPFVDVSLPLMYARICRGVFEEPPGISPDLRDLLRRLLTHAPAERLGHGGAREVREHPWFRGVDFDALSTRSVPAPHAPVLRDAFDASYFPFYAEEAQGRAKVPSTGLSAQEQALFSEF